MSQTFRDRAARNIPNYIGIYALCDLDNVPIYVGQSEDGVRTRVRRHITSARSDIIANRQVDVWEIAYVRCWEVDDISELDDLEEKLYHHYNDISPLMNGTIPSRPVDLESFIVPEFQMIAIMPDEERENRKSPELRLPRQAQHFTALLDYYLVVKSNPQIKLSLNAHFSRLNKYFEELE
ncbi:GIY-YIG nuclease family protein [Paenibacillus prosopidis]|uniref:GIY-YIG catalytic domain-containing protein n=1 Tax=Paenibacillus prosopidis TaxID=630520 RepID=A0A368WBF3_9BACL|nr:GIY-YIG nuclease family protein [Paenibacillus prosopidis]RCW52068.1 GIY-YIG catalytic domain-containing protein [Paenibacillus prosopidis]